MSRKVLKICDVHLSNAHMGENCRETAFNKETVCTMNGLLVSRNLGSGLIVYSSDSHLSPMKESKYIQSDTDTNLCVPMSRQSRCQVFVHNSGDI